MQSPAPQAMFATSSKGLHAFSLTGQVTSIGLSDTVVSQATARDDTLLAAVPVIHAVHEMMSYVKDDSQEQQSGLFLFDLSKGVQPKMQGKQVYNGNVKSCAIGKQSTSGEQRWYAGTEPADVVTSEDYGATWADTSSFQAITGREDWTFPGPPHIPHTLSIDFAPSPKADGEATAEDVVLAGIEVGGCLVSASDGLWETRHGSIIAETNRPQLCIDVHQVRPDPFDPNRWFATCGATPQVSGEGGTFVTEDQGASWRRIFDGGPGQQQAKDFAKGQGYAIGLALNPYRQEELIVTAGDQPPGIGVHVHHSRDGGITFQDITEDVYSKVDLQDCRGSHTPVPYFVKEGALLGSDTGDIIICQDVSQGGWKKLCKVPGHITTLTEANRSPSSVTH